MKKMLIVLGLLFFAVQVSAPEEGDIILRSVFNSIDFSTFDLQPRGETPFIAFSKRPIQIIIPFSVLDARETPDGNYLVIRTWGKYSIRVFGSIDTTDGDAPSLKDCVDVLGGWSQGNALTCWSTGYSDGENVFDGFRARAIKAGKTLIAQTRIKLTGMQDIPDPFGFDSTDWDLNESDFN